MNKICFWGIIELFAHCKGGNFNIHISGRCSAISSAKEGKSGPIIIWRRSNTLFGRAFHENPNRILTELTFINP